MEFHVVDAGYFKLDGGAMFGVVPRTLWARLNPPDEHNLCTWALRCLLVVHGDRRILVDTGIGNKQSDKFRSHFHPSGNTLAEGLASAGFTVDDITDVFITHLHFDHVGGALTLDSDNNIVPTFPNATYWSNKEHVAWALDPNLRERASFLRENIQPMVDMDILAYIDAGETRETQWMSGIDVLFVRGHTHNMMIPGFPFGNRKLVFCADLLPSSFHLRLPYVMSYDVRPLETLREKKSFLDKAVEESHILFLEHDPEHECITVAKDDRGRFVVEEYFTLEQLIASNLDA